MIEEKQKLSGNINTNQELNGDINVATIVIPPSLQEKEVTPTTSIQEITADENYNGLSKVTVNAMPEYFVEKQTDSSTGKIYFYIKKMPFIDTSNLTSMREMFYGCYNLQEFSLFDTSNVTNMMLAFGNCIRLKSIPQFDTSKVETMNNTFSTCYELRDVPILNTSKVTNMQNMFTNCRSLSDDSLDNILQMCINATIYTGTKTLYFLGLRSNYYPESKIQSLPHYQSFINAGWSIGY